MVQGIVGLPGSAKTYLLAKLGSEELKKNNHRNVYANFKLDGSIYFSDLKELLFIKRGMILVDEINLSCPSRWWGRFPPRLAYWWSQSRKMDLDIYWTSQHEDRVDKIVKEISNWIWQIKTIYLIPRKYLYPVITIARCYLPEQMSKAKRECFDTMYFRLTKKIWSCYNTNEIIQLANNIIRSDDVAENNN